VTKSRDLPDVVFEPDFGVEVEFTPDLELPEKEFPAMKIVPIIPSAPRYVVMNFPKGYFLDAFDA